MPRLRTSEKLWRDPILWDAEARANGTRPKVFPSLCDWLDAEVPIGMLGDFLKLMFATQNLNWLLLTKRPQLFFDRLGAAYRHAADNKDQKNEPFCLWLHAWLSGTEAPKNIWIGTSIEDNFRRKRAVDFCKLPAVLHFVSIEPLLEPVDLTSIPYRDDGVDYVLNALTGSRSMLNDDGPAAIATVPKTDFVIVGGESTKNAENSRPCDTEWILDIIKQCKNAGVPCFVKQLGSKACFHSDTGKTHRLRLQHPKGGDIAEWPECLRVREFPKLSQNPHWR